MSFSGHGIMEQISKKISNIFEKKKHTAKSLFLSFVKEIKRGATSLPGL